MIYKYETIIYWSNEDSAFIAEVPELPGCIAHGASQEEALANANEAIQLWLDTATALSLPYILITHSIKKNTHSKI